MSGYEIDLSILRRNTTISRDVEPYHMTLTLVKESVKAIRHLVSGGANPNSQNSHGLTPSDLVNSNKYIDQETQKRKCYPPTQIPHKCFKKNDNNQNPHN